MLTTSLQTQDCLCDIGGEFSLRIIIRGPNPVLSIQEADVSGTERHRRPDANPVHLRRAPQKY